MDFIKENETFCYSWLVFIPKAISFINYGIVHLK
jgi:hypothetical protein